MALRLKRAKVVLPPPKITVLQISAQTGPNRAQRRLQSRVLAKKLAKVDPAIRMNRRGRQSFVTYRRPQATNIPHITAIDDTGKRLCRCGCAA